MNSKIKNMQQAFNGTLPQWAEFFCGVQGSNEKSRMEDGDNKLAYLQSNPQKNVQGWTKKQLIRAVMVYDGRIADDTQFIDLEPNKTYGPLSYDQKVYIRDNLQGVKAADLAIFVQTNVANARIALNGQFELQEDISTVPNSKRPYGPLTYEEKVDIRDNYSTANAAQLAKRYNTHYVNVLRAQKGQFAIPVAVRQAVSTRRFGPLTIDEKRFIRDNRSTESAADLAMEYNTHQGNITLAQQSRFKDTKQVGLTALQKLEAYTAVLKEARSILIAADHDVGYIDEVLAL